MEEKQIPKEEFKHIVRVVNTDLDGNKPILLALRKIKGVSFMISSAVCSLTNVSGDKKTGVLSDSEVTKLNDVLKDIEKSVPSWLLNRRKDYETGENKHLLTGDLTFGVENDIRRMKKIKSYKGIRHMFSLPVRGQKMRSNFRKNKGKVTGVKRKAGAKSGK
ncbi:30S ribosomal protein S13 [Nanoarchaeota archaeon]